MDTKSFIVAEEEDGDRIDKYLAVKLGSDYSRTYVKDLITRSLVSVNNSSVKPNYRIKTNDAINITIAPLNKENFIKGEKIPLDIIYEDNSIIVIDKPSGMVVHPGAGNKQGTLVNAILNHCETLPDSGSFERPGIVHRLDKETSGVIVVAKTDKALRSLSKQFKNRTVKKEYIALVKGIVQFDNGKIDVPLARNENDRKKMEVSFDRGKKAMTIYHVLKRYKEYTYLSIEPETGRTHQIRVHMKHLGHPVLGDKTYGFHDKYDHLFLHAKKLGFYHPDTGKFIEFISKIPDFINKLT